MKRFFLASLFLNGGILLFILSLPSPGVPGRKKGGPVTISLLASSPSSLPPLIEQGMTTLLSSRRERRPSQGRSFPLGEGESPAPPLEDVSLVTLSSFGGLPTGAGELISFDPLPALDLSPSDEDHKWEESFLDEELFQESLAIERSTGFDFSWEGGAPRKIAKSSLLTIPDELLERVRMHEVEGNFSLAPTGGVLSAKILPPGSGSVEVDHILHHFLLSLLFDERSDGEGVDQQGVVAFSFVEAEK